MGYTLLVLIVHSERFKLVVTAGIMIHSITTVYLHNMGIDM